ncbi:ATP-binding protein [Stieleria marina]|uniref:hybrid sensor histidine kinase/response regulator n=1 Tax=Stieleria marina TaxID=1930275 RepID=UPI0011A6E3CC
MRIFRSEPESNDLVCQPRILVRTFARTFFKSGFLLSVAMIVAPSSRAIAQFFPLPGSYTQDAATEIQEGESIESSKLAETDDDGQDATATGDKATKDSATSKTDVIHNLDQLNDNIGIGHLKSVRFDVEAIMVYANFDRRFIRLQRDTATLSGDFRKAIVSECPKFGDRVRVRGQTIPGSQQTTIDLVKIVARGQGIEPLVLDSTRPANTKLQRGQYCRVQGELVEVAIEDDGYKLVLQNNGTRHRCRLRSYQSQIDFPAKIGQRIDFSGVAAGYYGDDKKHIHRSFLAMDDSQIQIDSATKPTEGLHRFEGTVVGKDSNNYIGVSNGESTDWIWTHFSAKVSPGSRVEILRDLQPESPQGKSFLGRAIKVLPGKATLDAHYVTATALANLPHQPTLVTTKARIESVFRRPEIIELGLTDDGVPFTAKINCPGLDYPKSVFEIGNLIQLTGIPRRLEPTHQGPNSFRLIVSDAADINVVARSIPVYAKQIGYAAIALAALAGTLAVWFFRWRRRMHRQSRKSDLLTSRLRESCEVFCEAIFIFDRDELLVQTTGNAASFFASAGNPPLDASTAAAQLAQTFRSPDDVLSYWRRSFDDKSFRASDEFPVDESTQVYAIRTAPLQDDNGDYDGRVFAMTDVSEKRQMEQAVSQSQKHIAVGRLAGGIAHDFNNLLMAISANVALANEYADVSSKVKHHNTIAQDATNRASKLTQQLLSFSRRSELSTKVCHINDCVNQVGSLMRHMLDKNIDLCLNMSSEVWPVKIDRIQIEHVLLNLCINARDSFVTSDSKQARGHISIQTRNSVHPEVGSCVQVCVEDDGQGMSEETVASAFEPFFTTKEVGQGTGLGLAMSLGIVQQHGGVIHCDSKLGVGSRFVIYLPKSDEPFASRVDGSTITVNRIKSSDKSKRVLLVDDEPMIRDAGSALLSALGHQTLCASDGQHALTLLEQDSDFDVVLLDLTMPVLSGRETLKQIKLRFPGLRVVISSGYSVDLNSLGDDAESAPDAVLSKPFSIEEIRRILTLPAAT